MKDSNRTQVDFTPGCTINLNNESNIPQRYKIEFGEYGSITFDALAGSQVSLQCGKLPPEIHILETNHKLGIIENESEEGHS
jgi:spore coat protein U-like protein